MNANDIMKNNTGHPLSIDNYLKHLINAKKALYELGQHETISLCQNDLCVHVYEGIGELAAAAGQTISIKQRNFKDFPIELYFIYQGVTFYQLKSAVSLQALGLIEMY